MNNLIWLIKQPNIDRLKNKGKVKKLIKALNYKKPSLIKKNSTDCLRYEAVKALGELKDPRAIDVLTFLLSNDESYDIYDIRNEAIYALLMIGENDLERFRNSKGIEALINILKDKNTELWIKTEIVVLLGKLETHKAIDIIVSLFENITLSQKAWKHDIEKINKFIQTLENLQWEPEKNNIGAMYWLFKNEFDKCLEIGEPAIEPLLIISKSLNLQKRNQISNILTQIGEPSIDKLIEFSMNNSIETKIRITAIDALWKINNARTIKALQEIVMNSEINMVFRRYALKSILMSSTDLALKFLITFIMQEKSAKNIIGLLIELGENLQQKRYIEVLISLAEKHTNIEIIEAIIEEVGRTSEKERSITGINYLQKIFKDANEHPKLKETSTRVLKNLGYKLNPDKKPNFNKKWEVTGEIKNFKHMFNKNNESIEKWNAVFESFQQHPEIKVRIISLEYEDCKKFRNGYFYLKFSNQLESNIELLDHSGAVTGSLGWDMWRSSILKEIAEIFSGKVKSDFSFVSTVEIIDYNGNKTISFTGEKSTLPNAERSVLILYDDYDKRLFNELKEKELINKVLYFAYFTRFDRLTKELMESLEKYPQSKVRLVCFYSGHDTHHFADKLDELQKAGKISKHFIIQLAVGSSPESWEKYKKLAVKRINQGKSVIILATDYDRELYNSIIDQCKVKHKNILNFGYDEE